MVDKGDWPTLCDICAAHEPGWTYPCSDFVSAAWVLPESGVNPFVSVGDWALCDDCHAVIERGQGVVARLVERAVAGNRAAGKVGDPRVMEMLVHGWRAMYADLLRYQTGPAYRATEEEIEAARDRLPDDAEEVNSSLARMALELRRQGRR